MKLISMTDFVLYQNREPKSQNEQSRAFYYCCNYTKFIKQPLELWMFVPCDEDGNVLEEKMIWADSDKDYLFESEAFDKYQQAKEKCLFQGFEYDGFKYLDYKNYSFKILEIKNMTIENLVKYNLQLTQTAIKQLEL